jgi:hypothetical protein
MTCSAQSGHSWVGESGLLRWPGYPSAEETDRLIDSKSASSAPAGYRFPVSERRNARAARTFFTRALEADHGRPKARPRPDARTEDDPLTAHDRDRARLRAKPAPRPLRTDRRRARPTIGSWWRSSPSRHSYNREHRLGRAATLPRPINTTPPMTLSPTRSSYPAPGMNTPDGVPIGPKFKAPIAYRPDEADVMIGVRGVLR